MKKLILSFLLFIPSILSAQVDEMRTGWHLGFGNATYISDNFTETPRPKLFVQGGGLLVYRMTDWWLIRTDLQFAYSSTSGNGILRDGSGFFSKDQPFTDKYRNFSLSLPLSFRIGPPLKKIRPFIELGAMPQVNLLNTEQRTYDSQSFNDQNGYAERKMEDASPLCAFAVFGGGIELHTEEERDYFLDFRYFYPLTDMGVSANQSVTMTGFTIGGGILF